MQTHNKYLRHTSNRQTADVSLPLDLRKLGVIIACHYMKTSIKQAVEKVKRKKIVHSLYQLKLNHATR